MDIKAIIRGKLPEGVTLTDEHLAAIAKDIAQAVGAEFVPKADYRAKVDRIDEIEGLLSAATAGSADAETYKKKWQDEKKAHDATKAAHESEKAIASKRAALRRCLNADGAHPDYIDLLEGQFDTSALELDGDKVKGWAEMLKPVKEKYAGLFGKVETRGLGVKTPPANNGGEPNPFKAGEHYSLEKQTKLYREDPARARQLAAEAGVTL